MKGNFPIKLACDFLIAHPETASEYGLKMLLLKIYEHERDGYTEAKKSFILKYTMQAKAEYAIDITPRK
ncbi:GrpB family protein [Sporomusa termitida]|uniref:GrpB family protein n=1 Tax=Sporomusa termitida TaxID=2377 RepID=UPI001185AF53